MNWFHHSYPHSWSWRHRNCSDRRGMSSLGECHLIIYRWKFSFMMNKYPDKYYLCAGQSGPSPSSSSHWLELIRRPQHHLCTPPFWLGCGYDWHGDTLHIFFFGLIFFLLCEIRELVNPVVGGTTVEKYYCPWFFLNPSSPSCTKATSSCVYVVVFLHVGGPFQHLIGPNRSSRDLGYMSWPKSIWSSR